MKKLICLVLVFLVSACTTSAVSTQDAKAVPAERLLYTGAGPSKITVTRDKGWYVGGGCYVMVILDGKEVARINTAESVTISVPDGRHILGITADRLGSGFCNSETFWPVKENSIELKDGEIQRFRISGDMNSGLDIRPTTRI